MDLNERAELFSVSVMLLSSSLGLEALCRGGELKDSEKANLRSTASLLCRMDHDSVYQGRSTTSEVLATTIRPYFYDSLLEQGENWANRQFLDNLYLTLASAGEERLLSEQEFSSASDLLDRMSKKVLSNLRRQYRSL